MPDHGAYVRPGPPGLRLPHPVSLVHHFVAQPATHLVDLRLGWRAEEMTGVGCLDRLPEHLVEGRESGTEWAGTSIVKVSRLTSGSRVSASRSSGESGSSGGGICSSRMASTSLAWACRSRTEVVEPSKTPRTGAMLSRQAAVPRGHIGHNSLRQNSHQRRVQAPGADRSGMFEWHLPRRAGLRATPGQAQSERAPRRPAAGRSHSRRVVVSTVVVGLALSVAASLAAERIDRRTEQRLLEVQTEQAASVLAAAVAAIERSLTTALSVDRLGGGDARSL